MKFKTKYFIIGLIIITVVSLLWINITTKEIVQENHKLVPQGPSIQSAVKGELKIEPTFSEADFNFPEALPTITFVGKTINKEYIDNIKEKLNMESDFIEFNDTFEGIKYFANSDTNYLVITPKTSMIKYGMSNNDFNKILDKGYKDEDFIDIAANFLIDSGLFDKNQISYSNIEYLSKNEDSEGLKEDSRGNAQLIGVSFNYLSNKYEIANNFSIKSPIYIELTKDGRIFSSEIKVVNEIKTGITEYPIKNYQEFISSINESKIISLEGDYFSVSDLKSIEDISQISVNSVKIAYYDEGKADEYLQPIFVIKANVKIINSVSDTAILYLPAYKK